MILLAILVHDIHGTCRMRVQREADAQKYCEHGWRLGGFETHRPRGGRGD